MTERRKPFLSYSNNFEDVILHRIFGDVPDGVFVDVGAADPKMENDCRALYDQGWSGINVEPNPALFRALVEQRPRDRSFDCALGAEPGEHRYFEVQGTGLSTLDPAEADRCRENGWPVVERVVQVRTLSGLLEECGLERIDLLKIDVEGWEEQVLRGNDWARFRPSVIMLEATLPERPERRLTGIEPFLSQHGYRLAHFDGLNDFFVRDDFRGADTAFRLAPNVFDDFVPYRLVELRNEALDLETALGEAKRFGEAEHAVRLRKQTDLEDAQRILFEEQQSNAAFRSSAQDRLALAAHELLDSQTDRTQLRASLLLQERRCGAYADTVEAFHRDREELLILRGQVDGLHRAIGGLEERLAAMGALAERRRLAEIETADWIGVIRRSTSWRLTLPMRVGGRLLRKVGARIAARTETRAETRTGAGMGGRRGAV